MILSDSLVLVLFFPKRIIKPLLSAEAVTVLNVPVGWHTESCSNITFCSCSRALKIDLVLTFGSACSSRERLFYSLLLDLTFFCRFTCAKYVLPLQREQIQPVKSDCVMRVWKRMALGVNIPPDVAHTVKTCFWTEDTNILDCPWPHTAPCHWSSNTAWVQTFVNLFLL